MAIALVTSFAPTANIRRSITAPPVVHVGQRLRYRVSVTRAARGRRTPCDCAPGTRATLIAVHAPGTFAYHGRRCATAGHLGAGRSFSFTVSGLASARGHVFPSTTATAVDVARPVRASTHVVVLGPVVACTATARRATAAKPPRARAAC